MPPENLREAPTRPPTCPRPFGGFNLAPTVLAAPPRDGIMESMNRTAMAAVNPGQPGPWLTVLHLHNQIGEHNVD